MLVNHYVFSMIHLIENTLVHQKKRRHKKKVYLFASALLACLSLLLNSFAWTYIDIEFAVFLFTLPALVLLFSIVAYYKL